MKKNKTKKLKSGIKKSLKDFMKDESGMISKENILKIGIGTVGALSMFSGMSEAAPPACNGSNVHVSDNTIQWEDTANGKRLIPSHTHHSAHCAY